MILMLSLGDDTSEKDLLFAMLMSTGDGSGTIKADWKEVEKIMTSWGYAFTLGAMCKHSCLTSIYFISKLTPLSTAQRWSKTIQKAFKERHPEISSDGGNTATGPTIPKTPASSKCKTKARQRPASEEDTPLASAGKEKASRSTAKKRKVSQDTENDDEEELVKIKGETESDEGHNPAA